MANHSENCTWKDLYFSLTAKNDNGPDESLHIDFDGVQYDTNINSYSLDTIQSIEFQFCPLCGCSLKGD